MRKCQCSVQRQLRRALYTSAAWLLLLAGATISLMIVTASPARANETVWACANGVDNVFAHAAVFGINTPYHCPGDALGPGGMAIEPGGNSVGRGERADWQANAPSGLAIVGASIPQSEMDSQDINDGGEWGGGFYWAGGGSQTHDGQNSAGFAPLWSSYFGWQIVCGAPSCNATPTWLSVTDIALYVQETTGPTLASNGLWRSTGWVRGDWNLEVSGDSPSGLCALGAKLDGQAVASSSSGQDTSTWHQCDAPAISQTIHTGRQPQGPVTLTLSGWDAAGLTVSSNKTIYIDNSQPTVSLSGPIDAPSTAGTQYVSASATAGPSGVAGIDCSVDGGPDTSYSANPAQVPVQGVGTHIVQCYARDRAVDGNGIPGGSTVKSWTLRIGEPTVSGITFGTRLVDALRCHPVRVRVRVKAHWVTVRRHGKKLRIRRPAAVRTRREARCHPRVVTRKIRVHGHAVSRRVVLLPHTVQISVKHVAYDRPAAVTGWVGLPSGTAIAGAPVRVMTATDNGADRWRLAAVATTDANGIWKAKLKPGPSRVIAAVYPGSATTESATSSTVVLRSSTSVSLGVRPRITAWGHTIRIGGRVRGGNIPAGKLLRLRIGTAGIYSTVGIPDINRRGTYRTTWTFAPGRGTIRYWFSVSTLPEADYPYAQTSSPRVYVIVHG